MKSLWTALSVIAIANLLALLGLVGWLQSSGRLDAARVRDVRQVFSKTVAEQKAELAAAEAKAEAEKKAAEEKAKASQPPVRAEEKLAIRLTEAQADLVRLDGVKRDVEVLRETMARERAALDEDKKKFEAERQAWQKQQQELAKQKEDAQFKKTLATLEGLKPDKAKSTLDELIRASNKDQVVAYLDAMQERTRTKVVDEFIKADPKLAADLLERLRTHGQLAQGPRNAP